MSNIDRDALCYLVFAVAVFVGAVLHALHMYLYE